MAKWAITFNGFGTEGETDADRWTHVNVSSYASEPIFGDDGISIETVQHTISGTALLSATTEAAFRNKLLRARTKLTAPSTPGASFKIYLDYTDGSGTNELASGENSTGGVAGVETATESATFTTEDAPTPGSVIYYGAEEDDYGIPTCRYEINEVFGTLTAIISFTITWHKLEPPTESSDWQVLHHSWSQSFDIDENGLTTLTVEGELRVRHYIQDQQAYANNRSLGTNPDRYRQLVMPDVPRNFRMQSMNWSTDRSGNRLLYRVTMREHARPLPYPAKTGRGRFSYTRGLGGQSQMLGTKVFDGELEGDRNSDPRELLNTLLRIAASRIMFGGAAGSGEMKSDLIQSVQVIEDDIFARKKIGLRIVALGMNTTSPFGMSNDPNGPIGTGFSLLDPFFDSTDELTLSESPNVYGTSLIQSVKRQMFVPWDPSDNSDWTTTEFPAAKWRRAYEWDGEEQVLTFDEEVVEDNSVAEAGQGDVSNSPIDISGHSDRPYVHVSGRESVVCNTNIVVASTQSLTSADLPFQVGKPIVTIESEYHLSRTKTPPKRLLLTKPQNAVVLSESFDVNRGAVDANNNNTYNAVYKRVVRLLDNPQGGGFYNQVVYIPGYGNIEMRAWWPPQQALSLPVDPRVENIPDEVSPGHIGRTLFDVETFPLPGSGENPNWNVGPKSPLYGDQ